MVIIFIVTTVTVVCHPPARCQALCLLFSHVLSHLLPSGPHHG